MTKKRLATRSIAMAMTFAMACPVLGQTGTAYAAGTDSIADAYKDQGYHLVWNDEFEGTSLNTDDWNIEEHAPGWVNAELQAYGDPDNLEVSDGTLKIYPKAEKKASSGEVDADILEGDGFDSVNWNGNTQGTGDADFVYENGKAIITIKNSGSLDYHVQFQQENLSVVEGHEYEFKVKAKSNVARNVKINFLDIARSYAWYAGGQVYTLGEEEQEITFKFSPDGLGDEEGKERITTDTLALQFSFGKLGDTDADTAAATVTLSDVSVVDLTAGQTTQYKQVLKNEGFDSADWIGSTQSTGVADFKYQNGAAVVTIENSGSLDYHVQLQQENISVVEGHEYEFRVKAKSDVARNVKINFLDIARNYAWYAGGQVYTLGEEEQEITFKFSPDGLGDEEGKERITTDTLALQFSFGKLGDTEADTAAATVTLSDVSVVDLSEEVSGKVDVKKDYNYTSGRVSTQNKHDFVYGYFEARLRVPEGMGYLPAFWLMATDEDDYGEWPRCGEVDIMEVMGQNIKKSYHTIHYGYDNDKGHKEGQSTLTLEEGDFSNEFHTFGLDWEPGKLTWYVDGVEVGSQTSWYAGNSAEERLAYPAPFDHQFYVILNLAIGGSWVGYPDQDVVDDMENQNFEIDYVRVYQKDAKEYAAMEAKLTEPEPEEVVYREPDQYDNYVVNGDFQKNLKAMDSKEDNFELHLEEDCEGTTYEIKNGAISITPDNVGSVAHSVQLKQTGIPMFKGWEYELTFDAYADEARSMIVDIEGPDHGWTRYLANTTVDLTTENQPYTLTFTMNEKTDANGSLEFNLGMQNSTVPVHISNVKLKHKSGEEIVDVFRKSVGSDGNYIYNGKFEQGEGRLGYWDVDTTANKKATVSVTNDLAQDGTRKRELNVKVVVPKGATELQPVIVSQGELSPIGTGSYVLSFDAYSTSGNTDGIKAVVGGKKYKPTLTSKKKNYSYNIKFNSGLTREESEVKFLFTKPGTYYLDNVVLTEASMIKNGYLDAELAGYAYAPYGTGAATFSVAAEVDGRKNVLDADIEAVGDADWNVQIKQGGILLEKGKSYRLTYDAKSTVARTGSVGMQKDGSKDDDWTVYSGGTWIDLTTEWKTFTKEFTMEKTTDPSVFLSIAIGRLNDEEVGAHHVYFDNFELIEIDADGNPVAGAAESKIDKTSDVYKVPTFTGWKTTSKGKMYYVKDKAVKKQWKQIDKKWYYFDADGIMASNEWIEGYWLNKDGSCTYKGKASWCKDDNGWYYMDTKKWYAKNQWQKIDGKWYYFKANGYMAANEYCKGYWLNKNGTWTYEAKASWKKDKVGWYYIDTKGWYAKSASYVIDGKKYNFNAKGYCTNP